MPANEGVSKNENCVVKLKDVFIFFVSCTMGIKKNLLTYEFIIIADMHSREPFKYVMCVLGTGKQIPLNKSNGGETAKCLPKGLYSSLTLMETMSQHHLVASRVYGLKVLKWLFFIYTSCKLISQQPLLDKRLIEAK